MKKVNRSDDAGHLTWEWVMWRKRIDLKIEIHPSSPVFDAQADGISTHSNIKIGLLVGERDQIFKQKNPKLGKTVTKNPT